MVIHTSAPCAPRQDRPLTVSVPHPIAAVSGASTLTYPAGGARSRYVRWQPFTRSGARRHPHQALQHPHRTGLPAVDSPLHPLSWQAPSAGTGLRTPQHVPQPPRCPRTRRRVHTEPGAQRHPLPLSRSTETKPTLGRRRSARQAASTPACRTDSRRDQACAGSTGRNRVVDGRSHLRRRPQTARMSAPARQGPRLRPGGGDGSRRQGTEGSRHNAAANADRATTHTPQSRAPAP